MKAKTVVAALAPPLPARRKEAVMSREMMLVVAGVLAVYAVAAARIYLRARKPRIVRCPLARKGARVTVDAVRAAALLAPASDYVLSGCSLWPARGACLQWCVEDLDLAAEGRRVQDVLTRWCRDKTCARCQQPIVIPPGAGFMPALLSPEGELREWAEVELESLFDVLDRHRPVCANCDVTERLRRQGRTAPSPTGPAARPLPGVPAR
jgi:hypothetical protein